MKRGAAILLFGCLSCGGAAPRAPLETSSPKAREHYNPPADGRLTEKQIALYVTACRSAKVPASADLRDPDPESSPDIAAARRMGMNLEEFLWVRQCILEARIAAGEREARRRDLETYRRTLASLERVRDGSTDPANRAVLERQIAELEKEAAALEREKVRAPDGISPANEALVERHRAEIDAAAGGPAWK